MPWESLIVEALLGSIAGRAVEGAVRIFQEHGQPWLSSIKTPTHAEKYLRLSAQELMALYQHEERLSITIGDTSYWAPIGVAVQPVASGKLGDEPFYCRLRNDQYKLPNRIAAYTEPILSQLRQGRDANLSDGIVVSLRKLERLETGEWQAQLAPASYFDALATNFAMDHKPQNCSQSLRGWISEKSGRLGDFNGSSLVNHIGLVCLIESADGYLVVQRRSAKVANRPNSLSASVTGALDYYDLPQKRRRLSLSELARGALREGAYELGIEVQELRFLGLIREFLRGGKPEIYLFGRSNRALRDIEASRRTALERYETRGIIGFEFHSDRVSSEEQSRVAFFNRARSLLEDTAKDANLTLVTAILLATRRVAGI